MTKLERDFQLEFLQRVREMIPHCEIIKIETGTIQGFPDRIILYRDRWVALEFKRNIRAPRQVNQTFYIDKLNSWSYAAFVSPENAQEVLDEIQRAFGIGRPSRISQR